MGMDTEFVVYTGGEGEWLYTLDDFEELLKAAPSRHKDSVLMYWRNNRDLNELVQTRYFEKLRAEHALSASDAVGFNSLAMRLGRKDLRRILKSLGRFNVVGDEKKMWKCTKRAVKDALLLTRFGLTVYYRVSF